VSSAQSEAEIVASAEVSAVGRHDRQSVRAAVMTLPDRQRDVVFLRYLADLSIAETARTLNISEGAVKASEHPCVEGAGSNLGRFPMTTDLERLVHDRLHAEIDKLVSDDVSPRREGGPTDLRTRTADTGKVEAHRWRVPLLAAAAVAVIAVVTIPPLHHDGPTTPQPDPAAVAAARSYVPIGTAMTPLAEDRAVKLLASWDQAAPHQPLPTDFRPDNVQVQGTSAGQGVQSIHVHGAVLTVEFIGGRLPKNQNCGYNYTVSALASTRAVAIFTNADPGTWPDGPDVGCAYSAETKTATITLPEPLGSRAVLDVTTGSVIVPTP
jgi:hypothetical protein